MSYQEIKYKDTAKERSAKSRMGIGAQNEQDRQILRRKRLPHQES